MGVKDGTLWRSGKRNLYSDGDFFYFDKFGDDSKITSDPWKISSIVIEDAEKQTRENPKTLKLKVDGQSRQLWFTTPVKDMTKFIEYVEDRQRRDEQIDVG